MSPEETVKSLKFYDEHFRCLVTAMLIPGQIEVLGSAKNKQCRFCGKAAPEVTFRKEAHAMPESLGNKSLFSNYECDNCNQKFGAGIEDSFGKWSKPMRMMTRIRGKSGVPTIKKGSQGGWRIEYGNAGFKISQVEDDPVLEVDEARKIVTFRLPREPYIPIAVLKTFVKMALTIMPEEELVNFRTALSWISELDHGKRLLPKGGYPVLATFIPGPTPNDKIALFIYRRRADTSPVPYAFFVLGYGNEVFQVMIPSPERDPVGISCSMPAFPNPRDIVPNEHGASKVRPLDLTGQTPVTPLLDLPGYLGATIAEMPLDDFARESILARAVRSPDRKERDVAHGLIYRTFADKKEPWAETLLKRAIDQNWGDTAILTILRALPVKRWTWEKANEAGPAIETEFWKHTPPLWMEGEVDDVVYMAEHLIDAGRARSALHFVGHHLPAGLPPALLVRVLKEAIKQPYESDGDSNEPTMFQHYVGEILQALDKAGVSDDEMLGLEWAYLPVLQYSPRPAKILLKALSERPPFFMDVLSAVFRPSEDSGVVETEPRDVEHARAVASRAFDLLQVWDRVPGADDSGRIDTGRLVAWIEDVRAIAAQKGRTDIADQKIGEALSASPAGLDNIWPAVPVRDALEKFANRHIETGFVIGRRNRRGVTTRMPRDGGAQERSLAETYRAYAAAMRDEWPHAAAAVEKIARGYDEDARWHDEDAERLDWSE